MQRTVCPHSTIAHSISFSKQILHMSLSESAMGVFAFSSAKVPGDCVAISETVLHVPVLLSLRVDVGLLSTSKSELVNCATNKHAIAK